VIIIKIHINYKIYSKIVVGVIMTKKTIVDENKSISLVAIKIITPG
jgi:hypothetical protein